MSDPSGRHDTQQWDNLSPEQLLKTLLYEIYNPVSTLGSQLKRLTSDEDPLTEEEYDEILSQMDAAVRQLSKTVVHLKRYTNDHPS
jgi:hypothetical protein